MLIYRVRGWELLRDCVVGRRGKKGGQKLENRGGEKGASVCSFWQSCAAVLSLASQVWCARNKYALTADTFKPQHFQFSLEFNLQSGKEEREVAVFLVGKYSQACQDAIRHTNRTAVCIRFNVVCCKYEQGNLLSIYNFAAKNFTKTIYFKAARITKISLGETTVSVSHIHILFFYLLCLRSRYTVSL